MRQRVRARSARARGTAQAAELNWRRRGARKFESARHTAHAFDSSTQRNMSYQLHWLSEEDLIRERDMLAKRWPWGSRYMQTERVYVMMARVDVVDDDHLSKLGCSVGSYARVKGCTRNHMTALLLYDLPHAPRFGVADFSSWFAPPLVDASHSVSLRAKLVEKLGDAMVRHWGLSHESEGPRLALRGLGPTTGVLCAWGCNSLDLGDLLNVVRHTGYAARLDVKAFEVQMKTPTVTPCVFRTDVDEQWE